MDLSKATVALGKYLTSKVADRVNAVAKKMKSTIDEGRALGKDFKDLLQKDFETVKKLDGTDDDVKKLDQLNLFKYLRELRDDLTGKKQYPLLDNDGNPQKDKNGNPLMTTQKPESDLILSHRTRGNLLLVAILALTFSGLGPFLLIGVMGLSLGITLHKSLKNAWKSLKAAFGNKQNAPAKTNPPSIDGVQSAPSLSQAGPAHSQKGPTIQSAAPQQQANQTRPGKLQQQQNGTLARTYNNVSAPAMREAGKPAPALQQAAASAPKAAPKQAARGPAMHAAHG